MKIGLDINMFLAIVMSIVATTSVAVLFEGEYTYHILEIAAFLNLWVLAIFLGSLYLLNRVFGVFR